MARKKKGISHGRHHHEHHDAIMRRLKHDHNHIAVMFLPQVKALLAGWAPMLRWLGVQYVVHHDHIDVVFRPVRAEHLIEEQLKFISAQIELMKTMLPGWRIRRGRIGGAKKMEDDCWMFWPKG